MKFNFNCSILIGLIQTVVTFQIAFDHVIINMELLDMEVILVLMTWTWTKAKALVDFLKIGNK